MRVFNKGLTVLKSVTITVSNYVKGTTIYLENDVGSDTTTFDIDANIAGAWESIGPTGSGATNIWTALDSVPIGAKWVELKIRNTCVDNTGALISQSIYGRVTGSSASASIRTSISHVNIDAAGSTATKMGYISTCKIPIDSSGRFDLLFSSGGTSRTVDMYLIGFGI